MRFGARKRIGRRKRKSVKKKLRKLAGVWCRLRLTVNPREAAMAKSVDKLAKEIRDLPDVEKLRLLDAILTDLDKPDPEIDRVWAEEARKRWVAYKAGKVPTVSYDAVMAKHRRS
jgi:putative addiction module component (TIGR02574 family)